MTTPATLVHPFYYITRLPNGRTYDPEGQGGAVLSLRLIRVETGTLVSTITDPVRVSYGVYRFDIPDTVDEDVYLGEVSWRRTSTSPEIVDNSLVVSVPERQESGLKPWVTLRELINYHPDIKGIPADIALDCIDAATEILYGLSGRKYSGQRVAHELYSYAGSHCVSGAEAAVGYSHNRRAHDPVIQLRGRPVQRVLQVSLDVTGAILPERLWRLVNARYLEPTRAGGWSTSQDVRVTYVYGVNPTRLAKQAAIALAGQFALAHQGSSACRLPERVTSVSRQGISFSILDPQDFLADGRTGVYEVDIFLKTVNPDKARSRPRVLVPDGPRSRSIAGIVQAQNIRPYPLIVEFGRSIDMTWTWRPYGVPNRITGVWEIRARAGVIDLTPYVTVEAANEPGRIDINIPAGVAATILVGTTWYLEAVLVSDPTNTQRLLTGDVQQSL